MNEPKKLSYFQGSRVFIGLRTNIFEKVENEHVTLEYVGSFPEWNYLLEQCEIMKAVFRNKPVKVRVSGYANWYNSNNDEDRYFDVALVEFEGFPEFSWSKNWHITLDKSNQPVEARQFSKDQDAFRYDICDDIYIGYKTSDGEQRWIPYEGNDTGRTEPVSA